jgi:hypothetical protein
MKAALAVIGVVLIAVGPVTLLAPDTAATAFGIPADTPAARAYLLAAGVRDVALGGWLLALLWLGARSRELAVSILAIAVVAAGDAANVVANVGSESGMALLVHIGGLTVMVALGCRLWMSRES